MTDRGITVGAITPTATADEVAAIVAAIELTWPRQVAERHVRASLWRFSGRSWARSAAWPRRSC